MEALKDRLKSLQSLPALPSTIIRLVRGLSSQSIGADELEAIVRTDEAISAIVLRMANSAQQGGATGRVFTLKESIARLGSRVLQKIAIAQQCQSVFGTGGEGFGLARGQLWIGALGGGVAAEQVAKKSGLADPSVCFVAGLLRDIGKLAMDQLIGVAEMKKVFTAIRPGMLQVDLETEAFGIQHAEVGAELAGLWGLPEEIANAIRFHHDPDQAAEADHDVCDVVHCGDAVAMWMGLGVGHDGLSYPISSRAKSAAGLRRRVVEEYMFTVRTELDKMMPEASPAGEPQ